MKTPMSSKAIDLLLPTTEPPAEPASGSFIAGMRVDAGSCATATTRILDWAKRGESRYVCVANVHSVMETNDSSTFRQVVNGADLVTSDGMPLVWLLRWRSHRNAQRVYGPDLMLSVCAAAADARVPIALLGGTPDVLERLTAVLRARFPKLDIALAIPPPFGAFSDRQNDEFVSRLAASGARIVFVGLGCPKQERWMAARRGQLAAVMLGVGAAFNFHAGEVRQAPPWLQRAGLEWAFRLAMEPRRLWRRYLWHNPRFIYAVGLEEIRRRFGRRSQIQP
jgi:N-acetylglucosaminyldiphosphoundecaprenol N-acetyl-beta-D-mannosaminyltransferase